MMLYSLNITIAWTKVVLSCDTKRQNEIKDDILVLIVDVVKNENINRCWGYKNGFTHYA